MNCEPNHWAVIMAGIGLVHMVFEYWIGKTQKVKSSSFLELVFTGIAMVAVLILRRKNGSKSD